MADAMQWADIDHCLTCFIYILNFKRKRVSVNKIFSVKYVDYEVT